VRVAADQVVLLEPVGEAVMVLVLRPELAAGVASDDALIVGGAGEEQELEQWKAGGACLGDQEGLQRAAQRAQREHELVSCERFRRCARWVVGLGLGRSHGPTAQQYDV
jgi:hypothetical protein